jgi:hypothetical protein
LTSVQFNLELCRNLIRGYKAHANAFLTTGEKAYLYECVRLITFELGLRFFADFLAGDVYFKSRYENQNLQRARVQFQLVRSIEAREHDIRDILSTL